MIIEAIFASLGCFKGPKSISSKFLRDIWISRTSRLSENYVLISLSACSRATWHWQISCFLYNKMFGLGREPWSSGYRRRLVFKRSWVRIPVPNTGATFLTMFKKWKTNVLMKMRFFVWQCEIIFISWIIKLYFKVCITLVQVQTWCGNDDSPGERKLTLDNLAFEQHDRMLK